MTETNLEEIVFETARKSHENYLLKYQEEDLQNAIESYVEVLNLNPEKAECYYRLASLMYESGQITLESTIEQCKKAISLNPKNINAYIYAGYYLEQANEFSDAEKTFKQAIKISELKSARARLILASTINKKLKNQGFNIIDGIKLVHYLSTGLITIFADFSTLKMFHKSILDYLSLKFYLNFGEIFEKFNLNLASNIYKKALIKTKHKETFYNKLAEIYTKQGCVKYAIECYKEILKLNPENSNIIIKLATLTQVHYPEKVDEIIDYYTLLLDIEEDLSPIYYELGHLYLQKNDKLNSVSAFKLALNGNEDNPYYNDALAYAYVQAELFDDAIEYYQKAIKLNPDRLWTVKVCHSLGLIYQKCKQNYEAAIASFQAGAILDPTNEDILISLGDIYTVQKEYDLAIKIYEDVININSNNYIAYSKLGITHYHKNHISEAIMAYEKALELNPEHDVTYNNIGILHLEETKNYEKALEYFNKALDINPNYTLAYFNKGRLLEEIGNYKDSAKQYQMALDLNRITNILDDNEIETRLFNLFRI